MALKEVVRLHVNMIAIRTVLDGVVDLYVVWRHKEHVKLIVD